MGPFLLLAVTFLLMWVLFILPQQRRMKAHQALVATLEEGDEVMLTSGVYGTITRLADDVVHLELAPGVVIRVARGAVARRVGDEPEAPAEPGRPSGTAADRAVESPDPVRPEEG
jgi:preprotein translocase subunit YajC